MDELEILMEIREDVAEIRAYNVDVQRRATELEYAKNCHDTRIRRVEVALLPISAGIGWIALQFTNFLNK